MKKSIQLFSFLILALSTQSTYAQKYKTVEDTGRLNLEYVKLSNEIADLTAKLATAQNDLPEYQSKATKAETDAQNAASSSSNQASKANGGDIDDARKAKTKARIAYKEAKDSRTAAKNLSEHQDKITRYNLQINKKQQRLKELDMMRAAINEKMLAPLVPEKQN